MNDRVPTAWSRLMSDEEIGARPGAPGSGAADGRFRFVFSVEMKLSSNVRSSRFAYRRSENEGRTSHCSRSSS